MSEGAGEIINQLLEVVASSKVGDGGRQEVNRLIELMCGGEMFESGREVIDGLIEVECSCKMGSLMGRSCTDSLKYHDVVRVMMWEGRGIFRN